MQEIPCKSNGQSVWEQRTTLTNTEYRLRFLWNQRLGQWNCELRDIDGDLIASFGLVVGYPLLRLVTDSRRPQGELFVSDTQATSSRTQLDPSFSELGERFSFIYFEPGESP